VRRSLILLALVAAVGAVVYVVHPGAGTTTAPAQYRHYFDMGRRICHRAGVGVAPSPPAGIHVVWSSLTVATILRPGPGVPVRYRSALEAGCSAAA
jgi:hypothetical protein